jgi:hypothetical protein
MSDIIQNIDKELFRDIVEFLASPGYEYSNITDALGCKHYQVDQVVKKLRAIFCPNEKSSKMLRLRLRESFKKSNGVYKSSIFNQIKIYE